MNFIDKAFAENLRGDDFLQAMADIYEHNDVDLEQYPQFVRDVILLIDYDSTLQMDGLEDVLYGSMKVNDIIAALKNAGADDEAELLEKAKDLPEDSEELGEIYDSLAMNNDYEGFWELLRNYIDRSLADQGE